MLASPSGESTSVSTNVLDYEVHPGDFDESMLAGSEVRSHWRVLLDQVENLGVVEVKRRWDEVQQLIRENGVTYNVYGDPRGTHRPWELDPIPLLLSAEDAANIEAGLIQRARLLEMILADIYGQQTLLTEGLLPAELVFGHPGYLRPCSRIQVPGGRYLHLYAADLARSTDGVFHVLRDRTQAPSGMGYALENRLVMARMLPEAFRECRAQRLAFFFQTLRQSLRNIAPHNQQDPRVVLLTPGPFNETYFEHAFLARYLGYTLVEGADLTVRDNVVYLKLLGGLQRVDVILRRLDDDYCDPLELRGDSFLGIPGLIQVIRAGNVAIANALGSGLIESAALLAFLPNICRRWLGEDLKMPSVPTWWCGDEASRSHVLTNLDRMVIKSTVRAGGAGTIFVSGLDASQRQRLIDRIKAKPFEYVGQEELSPSTTPVLVGEKLKPRHVLLRSFVTSNASSYAVMPGGLTRVAATDDSLLVSMQNGSGSKDTWVVSAEPVSDFTLLAPSIVPVHVRRDGGDLPSRAADDLFWLGRYAERVEGTIRLLRVALVRMTEKSGLNEVPELPHLLRALTDQTKTFPGFLGLGAEDRLAEPTRELLSILYEEKRVGSLANNVDSFHLVAGRVRDRLSTDMWRTIMSLESPRNESFRGTSHPSSLPSKSSDIKEPGKRRDLSEGLHRLDKMVVSLAAFSGMVAESMTRGQGWRFLDMGRRLERAMQILSLLRSTLICTSSHDGPLLEGLLEIADSSMTYRRRYMSHLQIEPLLDLLLLDEDNPRSLAFQLVCLAQSIEKLPKSNRMIAEGKEQVLIRSSLERLRAANVRVLAEWTLAGYRSELERFLCQIEMELPMISDTLTGNYLTHLQAARQQPTMSAIL
jgi:uncharacterized circularly permuted ATP-grasp superfamily protein/uncharacterized alpha-E superfamily protein